MLYVAWNEFYNILFRYYSAKQNLGESNMAVSWKAVTKNLKVQNIILAEW